MFLRVRAGFKLHSQYICHHNISRSVANAHVLLCECNSVVGHSVSLQKLPKTNFFFFPESLLASPYSTIRSYSSSNMDNSFPVSAQVRK